MKIASLSVLLLIGGCATSAATGPAVSEADRQMFAKLVRSAEIEGADTDPPQAAALLREAISDFDYAQRLPRNPTKAREMLAIARTEARQALTLARQRHDEQSSAIARAHAEASLAVQAVRAEITTAPAASNAAATAAENAPAR